MENYCLTLEVLEEPYCVCKGLPSHLIDRMLNKSNFFSLTKICDEISVLCNQSIILDFKEGVYEKDWKVLKIVGSLDFALVGILSNISLLLKNAGISLFVISTYDTDYIRVKESNLLQTICVLKEGVHIVLPL